MCWRTVLAWSVAVIILGGCASGSAPAPAATVMADCERSGGIWLAAVSQCMIGAGGAGGM